MSGNIPAKVILDNFLIQYLKCREIQYSRRIEVAKSKLETSSN